MAVGRRHRKILAVGYEAKNMVGRTPGTITSVRPLRDGVIADYTMTEAMMHHFMRRVQLLQPLFPQQGDDMRTLRRHRRGAEGGARGRH